ncbi:MAG: hypothetical protein JWR19_2951 [Pedosphaera sp.]|nr:hypothetical protein [Pedosphaera sp.]
MPAGSDRQEALAIAASAWAEQNFADATAWAKQLPDTAEQQKVLEIMADEAVYEHPVEALRLATTLAPSSALDGTTARAIAVWTRTAPEDAVSWAKQIRDEDSREQVITSIAATWGESNPAAAVNLAITSLRLGPVLDQTVITVVQRWAQTDALDAKAWVDQFPQGTFRQAAMAVLDESAKHNHPHAHGP